MKMSMEYPCIYFEKDGKCRKFSGNTAISYCVMGPCPEQKLSNADRIRAMSIEKLAVFLADESFRIVGAALDAYGVKMEDMEKLYDIGLSRRVVWLLSPAEDEDSEDEE